MKLHGVTCPVEVILSAPRGQQIALLILNLGARWEGEWLNSRPGRFVPKKGNSGTFLGGSPGRSGRFAEEKYLFACAESRTPIRVTRDLPVDVYKSDSSDIVCSLWRIVGRGGAYRNCTL